MNTCADERDLLSDLEHAVNNRDLQQLLQVYAENVDLAAPLPTSVRPYRDLRKANIYIYI